MEFSYRLRGVAADDITFSGPGLGSSANCFIADYSPFGVQLDCLSRIFIGRRTITSDKYRYGFQEQEKDDEVKGEGNSVNYKYRMHDARIGRFFAIDPLTASYPHYTPYSFSGNKLIAWGELEGLEEVLKIKQQLTPNTYKITYVNDVTAEARGEKGQIQEYDTGSGTLSVMRSTTVEERNSPTIKRMMRQKLNDENKGNTGDSEVTDGLGILRTDAEGNRVPYQQTKTARRVNQGFIGRETMVTFRDDVSITGLTAVQYGMGQFSSATTSRKRQMALPSVSLRNQLDNIAASYLTGDAIDINIQIRTDNPSTMVDIVQSNQMRQDGIVNYLVSQGVDRSSINTLPFLYNQPEWDAQVTFDQRVGSVNQNSSNNGSED